MNKTQEKNILIAERVPPSDRWILLPNKDIIYPSLIETLNAYHIMNVGKHKAYRLEPTQGKIYAIVETIQEVEPSKKYNIYNDYD
jgi:hypothetical protein